MGVFYNGAWGAWYMDTIHNAARHKGLKPKVTKCESHRLTTTAYTYPDQTLDKSSIGAGIMTVCRYDPIYSETGSMHLKLTIDGTVIWSDLQLAAYDVAVGWIWQEPDVTDTKPYWLFDTGFKVEVWHHIIPNTSTTCRVQWYELDWV
jgi:hypothetical protein